MEKIAAIVPAGGSGSRMGLAVPKQFCELAGLPVLVHTVRALQAVAAIGDIVLVAPAEHLGRTEELVAEYRLDRVRRVAVGGDTRQASVASGLSCLAADTDLVAVHDGARPLVPAAVIAACLEAAAVHGAAMAAVPVKDTLKEVDGAGRIVRTVDRSRLWQAQTPQVARYGLLVEAFRQAAADGFTGTDEASLLERLGCPVQVVAGSEKNIKITRPDDLVVAEALLMQEKTPAADAAIRVGHGYDAHRLGEGRPLVLGGVTVPHDRGLIGHSDADVLTHALCDAVLGAIGSGDIGRHFPDSDPRYRGIASLKLLAEVMAQAADRGFELINADVTVIAQQPKLAPHFPAMREALARVCQVAPGAINLKGTTTEGMGFAGREEGIAAHAVVLLGAAPQASSR